MNAKQTQLLVVGAGPGGYPAAFHAADLGMKVMLVDRDPEPGGVCLFRGCIPSKAFLHAAHALEYAAQAAEMGITFGPPKVDLDRLRAWKQGVVANLTKGVGQLTRARGIEFVQGDACFTGAQTAQIKTPAGAAVDVAFEHAIVATGSEPVRPAFLPELPEVMDSTGALEMDVIPGRLLVIGGGYIGLELGQVYAALGSRVSVVEMAPSLLAGADADLVRPLAVRLSKQFESVMLETRVVGVRKVEGGIEASFEGKAPPGKQVYDRILCAVGRRPVTRGLGLDAAGVRVKDGGFIAVDARMRTSQPSIQAVGDVAGQPMLAHKATHEGRSAVEFLHGGKAVYEPRAIPAVVFTDPEIAWCGVTEAEARRAGMDVRVGVFPWQASGRAATMAHREGVTKILADRGTGRVLGVGISGSGAGELIGEGVLAIEMGAVAEDLALTIHAHPSLSETLMEAAERVTGQSTHFFQRL